MCSGCAAAREPRRTAPRHASSNNAACRVGVVGTCNNTLPKCHLPVPMRQQPPTPHSLLFLQWCTVTALTTPRQKCTSRTPVHHAGSVHLTMLLGSAVLMCSLSRAPRWSVVCHRLQNRFSCRHALTAQATIPAGSRVLQAPQLVQSTGHSSGLPAESSTSPAEPPARQAQTASTRCGSLQGKI